MPGAPLVTSLLLVVRPRAPSSILAPPLWPEPLVASPLLVVRPGARSGQEPLVASLLLASRPGAPSIASLLLIEVLRPGASSSILAPSSMALSP